MANDETAVICDLAQTYGVLYYRELPVQLLAALVAGLGEESRTKRKMQGVDAKTDTLLLAAAVDRLGLLVWAKTEDGQKGRNQPKSILEAITQKDTDAKRWESDIVQFDSPEDFRRAWEGAKG